MAPRGKVLLLLGAAIDSQVVFVQGWAAPAGAGASAGRPLGQQLRGVAPELAEAAAVRPWALADAGSGAAGARPEEAEEAEAGGLPQWGRALLAGAAAMTVSIAGAGRARAEEQIPMYFGQGCFWHVQHDMVKKEVDSLGRTGQTITSLAGYAGGTKVGDGGRVCYHNLAMAPDYGSMGHTEVVEMSLPESKVREFAKGYFDAGSKYFGGRADPQDRGTEYRSAIGLPGGMDSPLFKEIEAANDGRMQLLRGEGGDADTVMTKKVWIYDSNKFPFHRGEVYHQFHDDMLERYSQSYHKFKDALVSRKAIQEVGCPEVGF